MLRTLRPLAVSARAPPRRRREERRVGRVRPRSSEGGRGNAVELAVRGRRSTTRRRPGRDVQQPGRRRVVDRPGVAPADRGRDHSGQPGRGRPGRLQDESAVSRVTESQLSQRVPRNAFVPSPVFVGIVALTVVSGWMTWSGFGNVRVDVFLMVICGWLLSLCLHEYAHALAAFVAGDRGVAERGYLRLNPLKYTHPILSIVLPIIAVILGGIGLPGGAVWVDHAHITSRAKQSLISAAGPLTNVVFALVLAVPFLAGWGPQIEVNQFGQYQLVGTADHLEFWAALALLAFLQVTASVLNFLPVPGLDGGNILQPWLSAQYQRPTTS